MTRLKLLFIVPHFNNTKKLIRCIESIHQNISNDYDFEISVVDDFSNTNTRNLLKNFRQLKNTHFIYLNKNIGVSNARNSGLRYAITNSFTHVTFVDCDDHLINKIQILDFKESDLNAHTNNDSYASETFGGNRIPNALFSFLLLPNVLSKLFKKFDISEIFDRHHFLTCYYSLLGVLLVEMVLPMRSVYISSLESAYNPTL